MMGIRPILSCSHRGTQTFIRLILVSLIVTAALLIFAGPASAAVINVPADQATIQGAINVASPGDTVSVAAGTYSEYLSVNKQVSIIGAGSALVSINYGGLAGSNNAGVYVSADNVSIQGVTIDGGGLTTPRYGLKFGAVSGGSVSDVIVQNAYRSGFDLLGTSSSSLSDIQSINNGGHGIALTDCNSIALSDITTSGSGWASVSIATLGNYTPLGTSGITLTGTNSFGGIFQLEEGDFNNPGVPPAGAAIITYSTNPADGADVTVQAGDFSYAMHGAQDDNPDQNRVMFYADLASAQSTVAACSAGCGHFTGLDMYVESIVDQTQLNISPGGSVQAAVDNASDGDTITIAAGNYAGANVDKDLTITGEPGAIIDSGPAYGTYTECDGHLADYGFQILGPGGSGTTISNLRFETVSFPVYGRGADDVTISDNTLIDPLQGITNKAQGTSGNRWVVSGNTIQDMRANNGGGIGIIMSDTSLGVVQDNVISDNSITGTLHVNACESGGYEGTGIVIYADFRWYPYYTGATAISGNQVIDNDINLDSDNPGVLGVSGIELTSAKDALSPPLPEVPSVVTGNTISGNTMDGSLAYGLNIIGASGNSITGNTVRNADNGLSIAESGGGSDGICYSYNNIVSGNVFIANGVQAAISAGNTGNNTDGNYWSDYVGPGPYLFTVGQDNSPTGPPQVTYLAPTGEVNVGYPLVTATATGGAAGGLTVELGLAGQLDPANPWDITLWTFPCTVDGGGNVSCPTSGLPEGDYTATVTVYDTNGMSGDATGNFNIVDNAPPVTTDDAPSGWQNSDVTVTLTCTDAVSGCASTSWSADNGGGSGTGTTIVVSAEGVTTITYHSVDNVGLVEADNTTTVSIDKTSPVVTYTGPTGIVYTNVTSITGTVTDAAPSSGIDSLTGAVLSLDGGATYPYGCTITAGSIDCPTPGLANGVYNAVLAVTDVAGNTGTDTGSFTYAANGRPDLGIGVSRIYWNSYADYLARNLSVDYVLTNHSVGISAMAVQIVGVNNTNSVVLLTPTPVAVGDIAAAANAGFTLKYGLPVGVTQFVSSIYATAEDPTGTSYSYPGPYPGP